MIELRSPPLTACIVASLALHAAAAVRLTAAPASIAAVAQAPPPDPSSTPIAGDSFEMPVDRDPSAASPDPASTPTPTSTPPPRPRPPGRLAAHPSPGASSSSGNSGPTPAAPSLFGAAGVRYATDVSTTFVRAFAQAASADPSWGMAPLGSAGVADVSLEIDENGRFVTFDVLGAPSAPLRRGVERTVALIASRTFTARGAVTRLRLTATITKDEVHDGLHGDVFALSGGSFTGDVGNAFFALPIGRRIDVDVKLLP